MLKRVLIANRGEIALRVRRACREAGIETVSVYSQADAEALHVQLATRSVCIGPAKAADSYLNPQALLSAALATGCDGLHPGYGFLSENPEFADACAENGITFIGPSGDAIRKAGSKSAARDLMRAAGVPVTPGSDGPVSSVEDALAVAETVGYPVLLKASAGGGGRGIRRCDSAKDLPDAYAAAKAEANACFGNDEMYLEKLVLEIATVLILVLTVGNVFSRKVIHQSWSFTEELVVAVFVLITLLAAALACRDGELVNLTILTDRLPAQVRKVFLLFSTILSVAFTAVLFKYGLDKVITQMQNGKRTFVLNWPEWIFWSFVPIGSVCMILHFIEFCLDVCTKKEDK